MARGYLPEDLDNDLEIDGGKSCAAIRIVEFQVVHATRTTMVGVGSLAVSKAWIRHSRADILLVT